MHPQCTAHYNVTITLCACTVSHDTGSEDDVTALGAGRRSGLVYATGCAHGRVDVWSMLTVQRATHPLVALPPAAAGAVRALDFDHDEEVLLAVAEPGGGTVTLWDIETQQAALQTALVAGGRVAGPLCAAFSRSGELVACAGEDTDAGPLVRLFDVRQKRAVAAWDGAALGGAPVTALQFSPDGAWLVTGSARGTVCVWDLGGAGPARQTHDLARHGAVSALDVRGSRVAVGARDGTATLLDLAHARVLGASGSSGGPLRAVALAKRPATQGSSSVYCLGDRALELRVLGDDGSEKSEGAVVAAWRREWGALGTISLPAAAQCVVTSAHGTTVEIFTCSAPTSASAAAAPAAAAVVPGNVGSAICRATPRKETRRKSLARELLTRKDTSEPDAKRPRQLAPVPRPVPPRHDSSEEQSVLLSPEQLPQPPTIVASLHIMQVAGDSSDVHADVVAMLGARERALRDVHEHCARGDCAGAMAAAWASRDLVVVADFVAAAVVRHPQLFVTGAALRTFHAPAVAALLGSPYAYLAEQGVRLLEAVLDCADDALGAADQRSSTLLRVLRALRQRIAEMQHGAGTALLPKRLPVVLERLDALLKSPR